MNTRTDDGCWGVAVTVMLPYRLSKETATETVARALGIRSSTSERERMSSAYDQGLKAQCLERAGGTYQLVVVEVAAWIARSMCAGQTGRARPRRRDQVDQ
jgi:hypothetical protein